MEEDTPRECTNQACVNLKQSLIVMTQQRQRVMAERANVEQLSMEREQARVQLHNCEQIIRELMQSQEVATNEIQTLKETAARAQESADYYKKRYEEVAPKEAESNKHLQSANEWRDKYDNMGALAEQLEAKLEETQQKYVSTISLLDKLQKKSSQQKAQLDTAQTKATELNDQRKNLNKYLKNVVFLVDNLSTSSNLAKQPKRIRDLVETFRRDDVRAYFNAPIFRNSAVNNGQFNDDDNDNNATGDDNEQELLNGGRDEPSSSGEPINDLGLTLSDDEDEEHINAIEKIMTAAVITEKAQPSRPDLGSKLNELKAKRNAVERVDVNKVKNWPKGIRKPFTAHKGDEKDFGIINPRTVHTRTIPMLRSSNQHDFESLNNAAMQRTKALLDRIESTSAEEVVGKASAPASATIHGRKGKTVAEQQSEMMKVSVKERVAMMKAAAENSQKTPEKAKVVEKMAPTQESLGLDMSPSPAKQIGRGNASFTLSEASEAPETLDHQNLSDLDNDVVVDAPPPIIEAPLVRTPSSRASAFQANIKNMPSFMKLPLSNPSSPKKHQPVGILKKKCTSSGPKLAKTPVKAAPSTPGKALSRDERALLRSSRLSISSQESVDEKEKPKNEKNTDNDNILWREGIDANLILPAGRRRSCSVVSSSSRNGATSSKPSPAKSVGKSQKKLPKSHVGEKPTEESRSRSSSVASRASHGRNSISQREVMLLGDNLILPHDRRRSCSRSFSRSGSVVRTPSKEKPSPAGSIEEEKSPEALPRRHIERPRNGNASSDDRRRSCSAVRSSDRISNKSGSVDATPLVEPSPAKSVGKTPRMLPKKAVAYRKSIEASRVSKQSQSVTRTESKANDLKDDIRERISRSATKAPVSRLPTEKSPVRNIRSTRAAVRESNTRSSSRASSVVSTASVRTLRNRTQVQAAVPDVDKSKINTPTSSKNIPIGRKSPRFLDQQPPTAIIRDLKKKAVAKLDSSAGSAPIRVKTAPVKQKGQKRKLEVEPENEDTEEGTKRITRSQQRPSESVGIVKKLKNEKPVVLVRMDSQTDTLDDTDESSYNDEDTSFRLEQSFESNSELRTNYKRKAKESLNFNEKALQMGRGKELMIDEEHSMGRRSARVFGGGAGVSDNEEDLAGKSSQPRVSLNNDDFSSDEDQLRIDYSDDDEEVKMSIDVDDETVEVRPVVKEPAPMVVEEPAPMIDEPIVEKLDTVEKTAPKEVHIVEYSSSSSSSDMTIQENSSTFRVSLEAPTPAEPLPMVEETVSSSNEVHIVEYSSSSSSSDLTIQEAPTTFQEVDLPTVVEESSTNQDVPLEVAETSSSVQNPETVDVAVVEKNTPEPTKEAAKTKKPALSVAERQEELGLIMSDSDSDEGEEDLKMVTVKTTAAPKKEVKKRTPTKGPKPSVKAPKPVVIKALPIGKKTPVAKASVLPASSSSDNPSSSASNEAVGKKSAILIEPIGKGKRGTAAAKKKLSAKELKKQGGPKAQLRQALDLKLPVQELNRPMEEKGFVLDRSIPLSAEEAVDVMIEFLKETSPSDMWMVLLRHKIDGNAAPLINNDEQNFLNVSVSLNDDDQNLLKIFISRIMFELATRDSFNSTQLGCYTRLLCHAVRFVEVEDEQKVEWMKKLVQILFLKNEAHAIKCIAYCLNSDSSDYFRWLLEDLDEENDLSLVFRSLLHVDSEQASVVNWLLSIKFQTPYISAPKEKEIANRAKMYFDKFCNQMNVILEDEDATVEPDALKYLKASVTLAKTGDPGLLQLVFDEMKGVMGRLEDQFVDNEAGKDKPRNIFELPSSSASTISSGDGKEIFLKFEWLKNMMFIFIENSQGTLWMTIIAALTEISVQIVRIKSHVESKDIEKIDRNGRVPVRQSILGMCTFISQFTHFPLQNGASIQS